MTKRRIAKIMGEAGRLHKIGINLRRIWERMDEKSTNGASYLPDFHAVRQTGPIKIVLAGAKDLRLRLKASECATMDNAISINRERTTIVVGSPRLWKAALVKTVVHSSIIALTAPVSGTNPQAVRNSLLILVSFWSRRRSFCLA